MNNSLQQSAYRILTVCTGNICRSPMAEVVLRQRFGELGLDVAIDSAGVSAEEEGNPMDDRAQAALRRRGYVPGDHTSRPINAEWLDERDLILVMTAQHERFVRRLAGEHGTRAGHIHRYREFDDANPHDLDIADPWYGVDADYEAVVDELESGLEGVVDHVRSGP